MGNVYFLSQLEAERLAPVSGAAMISITDPDKAPAQLGQWDYLLRESFYDGGYSRETIRTMKESIPFKYASYFDAEQAQIRFHPEQGNRAPKPYGVQAARKSAAL